MPHSYPRRPALTVLEVLTALIVLTIGMTLIAELGLWSLAERRRDAVRQDAVETAANILEKARIASWEQLTPEWAAQHTLPEPLAARMLDGKLSVRVEKEKGTPDVKRVSVLVQWNLDVGMSARPVHLVGLFGHRGSATSGDKP
jgi:hypothetical protein